MNFCISECRHTSYFIAHNREINDTKMLSNGHWVLQEVYTLYTVPYRSKKGLKWFVIKMSKAYQTSFLPMKFICKNWQIHFWAFLAWNCPGDLLGRRENSRVFTCYDTGSLSLCWCEQSTSPCSTLLYTFQTISTVESMNYSLSQHHLAATRGY